jgi:tryptophan synthase alpha chain
LSQKLRSLFQRARRNKKALFLPYFCVGYPSYGASLQAAQAALDNGAAALELGVPFSDPIADGPTLQKATFHALSHGTKVTDVFRLIRDLRKKNYRQPLLAMTYLNLVERMGWERFADLLLGAGGDGAIIPDLPLEQFGAFNVFLRKKNLSLIPFLAPTSSLDRAKMADTQGAPFLYYVSVTGVTGARKSLSSGLVPALKRLRGTVKTPVVVGFGISTPAQAARVAKAADGVIIASALVQLISKTKVSRIGAVVGRFCGQVVKALNGGNSKF